MKHRIVLCIFFLSSYQALFSSASDHERHAALKGAVRNLRDSITPGRTPEEGLVSLMTPSPEGDLHQTPTLSSTDEQGRSLPHHHRDVRNLSICSLDSHSSPESGQPTTPQGPATPQGNISPQWRLRDAMQRIKDRTRLVTFSLTPPQPTSPENSDSYLRPSSSPSDLHRRPTLTPAQRLDALTRQNSDSVVEHNSPAQPATPGTAVSADQASPVSPQMHREPSALTYFLAGSVSTTVAVLGTLSIVAPERQPRRAFTGFEVPAAMIAGDTAAKLFGATALIFAATRAASKFNSWLHAGCRSDKKLLEKKFEGYLDERMMAHRQETVQQITDLTKQTQAELQNIRAETNETITHVITAMDAVADILEPKNLAAGSAPNSAKAATILHKAAQDASQELENHAARSTILIPPPPPKEKSGCWCC